MNLVLERKCEQQAKFLVGSALIVSPDAFKLVQFVSKACNKHLTDSPPGCIKRGNNPAGRDGSAAGN